METNLTNKFFFEKSKESLSLKADSERYWCQFTLFYKNKVSVDGKLYEWTL